MSRFAPTLLATLLLSAAPQTGATPLPNIVLILADDLGYGDVGCYNPESKVPTPNLDRLAAEGMRFTDAHSPATVCTPTRYSVLTGRMAFRTGYGSVFTGVGGPNLIEPERLTLPGMLREKGYATAMFGKWHVGLTFLDRDGSRVTQGGVEGVRQVDFSRAIPDAPVHRGFDRFFGTACCPTTDWLYAYIDGDRIPVPPSLTEVRPAPPDHPYSRDCRPGLIAPDFDLEEVDLVFLEKSRAFLRHFAEQNRFRDQPFFLFHSMQAVHLPSLAAKPFQGKSGAGPHGDFLFEMDWIVGELMRELEESGLKDNTLVIFASDNGPEIASVKNMRQDYGHDGARPWRGIKRDAWEGGHRTPFLVRWPRKVAGGSVNDDLLSLTDILATCAAMVDFDLPNEAGEDSFNQLPSWLGESDAPIRPIMIQQTFGRRHLSIRRGNWKYLDHRGSGGNNYEKTGAWGMQEYARPDTDPEAPGQLYNLAEDPGETTNLYSRHPETVAELKALLDKAVSSGRTAPVR